MLHGAWPRPADATDDLDASLERAVRAQVQAGLELVPDPLVPWLGCETLVETVASVVLLFWWYHLDKAEHRYAAGRLMNAGVLVLAVIALPIYFLRTRGWRRGGVTIALAAAFVLLTFVLGEAGEGLGTWLRA